LQKHVSHLIPLPVFRTVMLSTVNLDREHGIRAVEIQDIWTEGNLPPELCAFQPAVPQA